MTHRKLKPQSVVLILSTTTALGVMSAFFFLIEPQRSRIPEQANTVSLKKVELELARQAADNVSRFQEEYQSIIDTDQEISEHFFSVGEELDFFQAIEEYARQSGVTLAISFTPKKASPRFDTIPVTLSVSGSTAQLLSFLDELERSPRYLTVKKLSFVAADTPTATFEMNSYWYASTK